MGSHSRLSAGLGRRSRPRGAPGPAAPEGCGCLGGCRLAPLSAGPARAAAAIMLCLLLTVLAHLFPAACAGVHERTFLAVKPDGVQRRLVGEIVRRFERKGFKLVALKLVQASDELLREHYAELRERPFYGRLVDYMGSGPVVAMVWQGLDVVRASRALIGATDPADAAPGTIRGDFCVEERDPRQRLGGERPPRDRALVPRRRVAVLGGQRRALAVRVAPPAPPVCSPPWPAALTSISLHSKVKQILNLPLVWTQGHGATMLRHLLHTERIRGFACRAKA
ncbi:nucleoside diphosphate kinase 3 isoform X1 [Ursus americanus]|uniref:nucleoside diphosphate kinase 3 isoform X1 n=1 Tax=Ursus arctos TaxID=9644 RepID=UPI000E6DB963|nr:nucleoside diphosphate kinase 3 isoform X1 [Ursus arctos]XP_045640729.1 nucleoside diphosphate kinase 3 isoform X1 [Ursus americanus]